MEAVENISENDDVGAAAYALVFHLHKSAESGPVDTHQVLQFWMNRNWMDTSEGT